jgi:hypothetical protein
MSFALNPELMARTCASARVSGKKVTTAIQEVFETTNLRGPTECYLTNKAKGVSQTGGINLQSQWPLLADTCSRTAISSLK